MWIHKLELAERVLSELLSATKNINEDSQEKLAEVRLKVLKRGG